MPAASARKPSKVTLCVSLASTSVMVTVPARAPEGCETAISGASLLPLMVTVMVSVILLPVLSAMVILPKLSVTVSPSAR